MSKETVVKINHDNNKVIVITTDVKRIECIKKIVDMKPYYEFLGCKGWCFDYTNKAIIRQVLTQL